MYIKQYENPVLRDKATRLINAMSVRDIYKPLLVDIILRRAYEFGLTEQEATFDIYTLVNNLKEIDIKKMPYGYRNCNGVYFPKNKSIMISNELFNRKPVDYVGIYETLTHEVYHALSRDSRGNDRLLTRNIYTGTSHVSLLETIISKCSNRAVENRVRDNIFFNSSKYGYNATTFALDIIASVYGVSERELLQSSLKGKDNLVESLSFKKNEPKDKTLKYIDAIEANLTRIHNTCYTDKSISQLSPQERIHAINEITGGLIGISLATEDHVNKLFWFSDTRNPYRKIQVENEFQYSIAKISYIMERALDFFSNSFNYDFRPAFYYETDRAMGANDNIYSIINRNRHNLLSNDILYRMQRDDFSPEAWDNREVTEYIQKFLEPEARSLTLSKARAFTRKVLGADEPEIGEKTRPIDRLRVSRNRTPDWQLSESEIRRIDRARKEFVLNQNNKDGQNQNRNTNNRGNNGR